MYFLDHSVLKTLAFGVRGLLIILSIETILPVLSLGVIYALFSSFAWLKIIPLVALSILCKF